MKYVYTATAAATTTTTIIIITIIIIIITPLRSVTHQTPREQRAFTSTPRSSDPNNLTAARLLSKIPSVHVPPPPQRHLHIHVSRKEPLSWASWSQSISSQHTQRPCTEHCDISALWRSARNSGINEWKFWTTANNAKYPSECPPTGNTAPPTALCVYFVIPCLRL